MVLFQLFLLIALFSVFGRFVGGRGFEFVLGLFRLGFRTMGWRPWRLGFRNNLHFLRLVPHDKI